jgi:membrane fusion protein (multidrug efflux system)
MVSANRQVDPGTGTIQIQALFPNPDNLVRPGQYARVRIRRRDAGAQTLVVPESALLQLQGTYSVAVVGADSKVSVRRIEVGPGAGTWRVVASGLSEGERIVVEGVQKVSEGLLVNARPQKPPVGATN